MVRQVMLRLSRPSCIAHGSGKQGGRHEGSMSPVTSPVSLVIFLTLDGKEANMDNLDTWHKHNVEAGDAASPCLCPGAVGTPSTITRRAWSSATSVMIF
jgi:hypothetical protein